MSIGDLAYLFLALARLYIPIDYGGGLTLLSGLTKSNIKLLFLLILSFVRGLKVHSLTSSSR